MKTNKWRIEDLVDLEFFINRDESVEPEELAARDREIYARFTGDAGGHSGEASALLHCWLEYRRSAAVEMGQGQPGKIWKELAALFFWGSLFGGLLSGGLFAFSLLSYSGLRPVNVSTCFVLLVLVEFLLFFLLLLFSLFRSILGRGLESSLLYRMVRELFLLTWGRIVRGVAARGSARDRLLLFAGAGGLKRLWKRYENVFARHLFFPVQLLGVGFNTGILAAILLKVIGSDVAFGWQTTLQVDASTIHHLVWWISAPWAWIFPEGCPGIEEIEGSRLILKDGIYQLATHDLVSWWPFLVMSVFFYGLLPRIVLLLTSFLKQRRELMNLSFDYGPYGLIVNRMRTPLVSSAARVEEPSAWPLESKETVRGHTFKKKPAPEKRSESETTGPATMAVLIPDEFFEGFPVEELKQKVLERLGLMICDLLPFWTMELDEDEELHAVKKSVAEERCRGVILVQEAWQPPIQEFISFLVALRKTIGEEADIIVVLIGRAEEATMLTRVKETDLRIWRQNISSIADPHLQTVELVT